MALMVFSTRIDPSWLTVIALSKLVMRSCAARASLGTDRRNAIATKVARVSSLRFLICTPLASRFDRQHNAVEDGTPALHGGSLRPAHGGQKHKDCRQHENRQASFFMAGA